MSWFITDFIINDGNQFSLKNTNDNILPILRFKTRTTVVKKHQGILGFIVKFVLTDYTFHNLKLLLR